MTPADMRQRGWNQLDVLLVTGDAYIDHPAFGVPLLARWLEHHGYKVGIIAQPRWDTTDDFLRLGRPRLYCGISAGALDSMLCHYTAFRKKRHDDPYTPGGQCGARPNRAAIVYANLARAAFPGLPIVIGGIEASLRKFAHYDFWTDALRRSILFDAKADLLQYGMGELSTLEIARRLEAGAALDGIPGTARIAATDEGAQLLPSFEDIQADHKRLLDATRTAEQHVHTGTKPLAQRHANRFVIVEPPMRPVTQQEMDTIYSLPFLREQHPAYEQRIPALDMIRTSITAVRGCGGACSFCSLAQHQGRKLTSRSPESVIAEAKALTRLDAWKGNISDVGGPTANLWGAACAINAKNCSRQSCLTPAICPNLKLRQKDFLALLRKVKAVEGVKSVGVASGIRHDAALLDMDFIEGLTRDFVSGHLKLAPEHCQDNVLRLMRKPSFAVFEQFLETFQKLSEKYGREQFIVPYVISAFPGCTERDMKACADWFRRKHWQPQQVQCFIPTPGTVATAMFFARCDMDGNPLTVADTDRERLIQHGILFDAPSAPGTQTRRNVQHDDESKRTRKNSPRNARFNRKGKP